MQKILLAAAVIFFLIFTFLGFGAFHSSDPHMWGWLGLGLLSFAGSFLL